MSRGDTALPGWVEEANRRLRSRPRPEARDDWPRPPEVGEIRVAEPVDCEDGEPRLVYVLAVDNELGSARVALISNEVIMASEADLVLRGAEIGLPFDLLVEPELEGELWWIQIGRRLAGLGDRRLDSGARNRLDRFEGGPSVSDRELFKAEEAADLSRLVGPCGDIAAAGRDGVPLLVDPTLLARRTGEHNAAFLNRVLAVAGVVSRHPKVIVPAGSLDEVVAACVPSGGSGLGMDLGTALRPLLERSLTSSPEPSSETVVYEPGRIPTLASAERSLSAELLRLADLGQKSARLITDRERWADTASGASLPVAVECHGRGRVQVIRHTLEVLS